MEDYKEQFRDYLKYGERLDDLHRKGYMLIQNPNMFCFGLDAVLLSGFANAKADEAVLDLCCGNGIIPILMEAKTKCSQYVGVEILDENVDMARRSIKLNKLEKKIYIEKGDIRTLDKMYKPNKFDVVTCNPPYIRVEGGAINDNSPKAIARHEIMCTLTDVMSCASKMLKYGGRFYMVNRANRIADIFELSRKNDLEPKVVRFVYTNVKKEPSMVLIEFMKNGKPDLVVKPPLIIYDERGTYTEEVEDIYYGTTE